MPRFPKALVHILELLSKEQLRFTVCDHEVRSDSVYEVLPQLPPDTPVVYFDDSACSRVFFSHHVAPLWFCVWCDGTVPDSTKILMLVSRPYFHSQGEKEAGYTSPSFFLDLVQYLYS